MIVLGVVVLVVGARFDLGILYTLGGIMAVAGIILWLFGGLGRQVGPKPHYY